ncbi:MAG: hypothetical protein ACD_79C00188G0006 [uncultured bacterium]|nr:MAG: hypothetical protein ACD_79C00188G0006 [uncultured bacterium]
MNPLDKNYLLLQFKIKIYEKNGTEFQSFFENIMEKAYLDYQKIRPYGNKGDGGNDGYRKKSGIYYQIYAPITPKINESDAAKKLQKDFIKLQSKWTKISAIKEYNFVFNDKFGGSVLLLEEAMSNLKKSNPEINFNLFLAKDLENVFFQLSETDILNLNFNIDKRQAISNVNIYLERVKTELDRENVKFAQNNLRNLKEILLSFNDENLYLEYEILECRCLKSLEEVDKAREKYENISKKFPNDPESFLYLAEISLNDKDYCKNSELLEKAGKIDNNYWLLKLEQMLRNIYLGEIIDTKNIDENTLKYDSKINASFYRLYALYLEWNGDHTKADSFIEKAISLNPDRLSNYIVKLSLVKNRMLASQDSSEQLNKSNELLKEIEKVENMFFEYGEIGARNKAILNSKKLNALKLQENIRLIEKITQETFNLSLSCYFDTQIEQILTELLQFVRLADNDFNQLLEYLTKSKMLISDNLLKEIFVQFYIRDALFTLGKKFYDESKNIKYSEFIDEIENKNYDKFLKFVESDTLFAVSIANFTIENHSDLRKKIIDNLPDDKNIQKNMLLLLFKYDNKDFDEAFLILKKMDLSNLHYLECIPILEILHKKEAWDFEIIILQKLLEKEQNKKNIINLKLQLFNAYLKLKKYAEIIFLGELLLQESIKCDYIDEKNKEALLINTILACFERGKFDKTAFKKSKKILVDYPLTEPTFEFKVGIEAEIYINNNEIENALNCVLEGIKIKKVLSNHEYAKLYFLLNLKIGDQTDLNLDSLDRVKENTFVKLRNKDQWYHIGDDNELDAIPILKTSGKYQIFIEKKIDDMISFENSYTSEYHEDVVDKIFSIKKYVLWQTVQNFQNLSKNGDIDGIHLIEIPKKEESIDSKNIIKFLEDLHKKTEPFFKIYCNNNFPVSMLAVNEGGLLNAIGRIQRENKGFIHFCTGTIEEFEKQKEIVKKVIVNKMPFYIDGTSALFLSEKGLFKEIFNLLPNLKVPQSVINLLADIADELKYTYNQAGYMGYAQGKIVYSPVEKNKRELIQSNFIASIKALELNPENIGNISLANKMDCFSEKEIPDELCDACILSQNENIPILTDDFLYLTINQLETKKKIPEYFSSLALIRVLYENKQISFNEYLDYFVYLSSYRFRFLALNSDDIEKAVFGDGEIKTVNPENIKKLNFSLTLSEEYGVTFQNAFEVLREFLLKVLMNDAVSVDIAEKIFLEILVSFPSKMNKKDFGQMLLINCFSVIEDNKSKNILFSIGRLTYEKIYKLHQTIDIYSLSKLGIPN